MLNYKYVQLHNCKYVQQNTYVWSHMYTCIHMCRWYVLFNASMYMCYTYHILMSIHVQQIYICMYIHMKCIQQYARINIRIFFFGCVLQHCAGFALFYFIFFLFFLQGLLFFYRVWNVYSNMHASIYALSMCYILIVRGVCMFGKWHGTKHIVKGLFNISF